MMECTTLSTLFPAPGRYPAHQTTQSIYSHHHYDSVSFVYWRAIRQILYPGNICLILLSTDYRQYSDVIKRQIVMGDKVRLMLNSIWKHFQNRDQAGPSKTNMVLTLRERHLLLQLWTDLYIWADKKSPYNKIIRRIGLPLTTLSSLCRKYCVT